MEQTKTVEMTAQEAAAFAEFQEQQKAVAAEKQAKDNRQAYATLVDETISSCMKELYDLSGTMSQTKTSVIEQFRTVINMKSELFDTKEGQRSHTFTNAESTQRITVGFYTVDDWRDTVDEGIEIVRSCVKDMAKDDESQMLVDALIELTAKNKKGDLKASRVLQLRKMADKSNNERLKQGIQIIEESYQPTLSKQYIKAEIKDANNAWKAIPLGVTEA